MERHLRPVPSQESLITRESLAERWETSVDTIDRMRAAGMPSVRWGRKFVRFRYSECMAWLDQQTQETMEALAA